MHSPWPSWRKLPRRKVDAQKAGQDVSQADIKGQDPKEGKQKFHGQILLGFSPYIGSQKDAGPPNDDGQGKNLSADHPSKYCGDLVENDGHKGDARCYKHGQASTLK